VSPVGSGRVSAPAGRVKPSSMTSGTAATAILRRNASPQNVVSRRDKTEAGAGSVAVRTIRDGPGPR
jgi:hypothetical protein